MWSWCHCNDMWYLSWKFHFKSIFSNVNACVLCVCVSAVHSICFFFIFRMMEQMKWLNGIRCILILSQNRKIFTNKYFYFNLVCNESNRHSSTDQCLSYMLFELLDRYYEQSIAFIDSESHAYEMKWYASQINNCV